MKCPHCETSFFPQLSIIDPYNSITKDIGHKIGYQYCPNCDGLIVGVYEYNKKENPLPTSQDTSKGIKLYKQFQK
jgi:hypothetical protein